MKNPDNNPSLGLKPIASQQKLASKTTLPRRRGRKPKNVSADDEFNDLTFGNDSDNYDTSNAWSEYGRKPAFGRVDDEDIDESYTRSYGSRRPDSDEYDDYESNPFETFRRG